MPKMHLRQTRLYIALVDALRKAKKEYKHLKKQDIQNLFIKTN